MSFKAADHLDFTVKSWVQTVMFMFQTTGLNILWCVGNLFERKSWRKRVRVCFLIHSIAPPCTPTPQSFQVCIFDNELNYIVKE